MQSLASETTRKNYYCSAGSILFKVMNIKKYLALSLSNFYDYLWHLYSMGQPGCQLVSFIYYSKKNGGGGGGREMHLPPPPGYATGSSIKQVRASELFDQSHKVEASKLHRYFKTCCRDLEQCI